VFPSHTPCVRAVKTRHKITIDRWFGLPLVWSLNLLARALGVLLRRDHSVHPQTTRTIVVAKFFGMGSILQATPLLGALKRHFPQARLVFVTARGNRPLLERLPGIDACLYVDDASLLALATTTATTVVRLWHLRADLYFDLEVYSAYAALLSILSVARNRVGFYRYSTAFKRGLCTHLVFFNARQPIRRIYLQLGRAAGVPPPPQDELAPPRVDEADRAGLVGKLAALAGTERAAGPAWERGNGYLVINPNASDLLLERRWPLAGFADTIEALAEGEVRIVLIGSRDEAAHVAALRERLSPTVRRTVVDTSGLLTLGELLALLQEARCLLTNDTGPMHMSIALGRPTVCLFGPCSPDHYGIDRPGNEILYRPVFCSPCVHEVERPPCGGNNVCMQLIEPGEVVRAVRRALAHDASQRGHARHSRSEPPPEAGPPSRAMTAAAPGGSSPAAARPAASHAAAAADRAAVVLDDANGQPLGVVARSRSSTR
jgi:heptosyltransferase-2